MTFTKLFRRYIFDIPAILWFNFKHFPFRKAIRFPVLLHKTELIFFGGGKYIIDDSVPVYTGMIRVGHRHVSHFPNTGLFWIIKEQSFLRTLSAWEILVLFRWGEVLF